MKKTTLLMVLSMILAVALGVGSTMAYLQDTDEDVNVMTLGNVDIEQHEFERVQNEDGTYEMVTSEKYGEGYKLQEFTQGKPLYPAVGEVTGYGTGVYFDQLGEGASGGHKVLDGLNNVQDKFVLVENTGKSDAYVRTIIAYEMGDLSFAEWDYLFMNNFGDFWTHTDVGEAVIDGGKYFLIEYLYNGSETRHLGGVLPAGEWTYNNLAQVYLKPEATNETMEAIDGNKNGTYDILVVSQAVQTMGFADAETALDTAFGEISVNSHPWMDLDGKTDEEGDQAPDGAEFPVLVSTADELVAAIAAGGDVYLTDDIDIGEEAIVIAKDNEVTLNLNGKKLTGANDSVDSCYMIDNKGKLTINGDGVIDFASTCDASGSIGDGYYTITNTGDLTINGGVIKNSSNDGWLADGHMGKIATAIDHKAGSLTINDGTIESTYRSLRVAPFGGNVVAEINGGKFVGQVWVQSLNGSKTSILTVNGGEYGPVGSDGSSIFVDNSDGKATAVINDGIFNTKIGANALTKFVKGGTFATQDAYDKTNAALFAADNTVTVK
ncbi:MAG: hypothetical protein IKB78_00925 [Clostridia bacterium]|nr:hypothetical protein [Clostridia bacterium]